MGYELTLLSCSRFEEELEEDGVVFGSSKLLEWILNLDGF